MKKLLLILLLCCPLVFWGQVNIINQSLTDSSLKILYIGVNNSIKIIGDTDTQAALSATGVTLHKIGTGVYNLKVSKPGTYQLLYKTGKTLIFKKTYQAKILQLKPVASVNGLRDTTVKIDRILENPFVTVIMPGSFYRHSFSVLSFSATFINNKDSTLTSTIGNSLSREQILQCKGQHHGGKIYFSAIRVTCYDCKNRSLAPFWIKVE